MAFDKVTSRADQCTVLENVTGNSPCNLNSGTICSGSQQCTCSGISYFLAAACQVCANDATLSWEQYATTSHCSGLPEPVPSPFPTQADPNHVIPSWVVVMAAATPSPSTFDAAVASAIVTSLAGGSPTTSSTSTATTLPPQTVTVSSSAPPPTSSSQSRSQSSSLILAASSSLSTQSSLSRATNATSTITQIASPSASTIASGATSADAQAALHQNSALAIIVGIFIALFVMVFVVIVLLCLRRRRRRSQIQSPDAYTRSTGRSMSIPFLNITASVPSDTSPVDTAAEKALEAGSPSTLRRSDTGNDSRSTRLSAGPSTSVAAGKILGVFSSRRAVNAGPQSPDSDVINGLTARIRDLEAQVQSMALPDEAPPVYVKEVSGSMRSDQQ